MEVTLKPDNRKATIIGGISDDLVKVRLEDGREFPWPISKINMPPKEGEETLKMVVIPAIDRLEEFKKDFIRLSELRFWVIDTTAKREFKDNADHNLARELLAESEQEFEKKWGL